ncbi:hypothetical protein NBRC116590_33200 [Pelagimonas sp. KU-00592-HH]
MFAKHEGRSEVDLKGGGPILFCGFQRGAFAHQARVVDKNIKAAKTPDDFGNKPLWGGGVEKVGLDPFMGRIGAALGGDDGGTVRSEAGRGRRADAASTAGDENNLVCETCHWTDLPPFTSSRAPHM